jgi:hypothetical protein
MPSPKRRSPLAAGPRASTGVRGATPRSSTRRSPSAVASLALLVIDDEKLRQVAWAEFTAMQQRMAKATAELHRHEEVDVPAFQQWLYRTFPRTLTELRELHAQVQSLNEKVRAAQAQAFFHGGSLKRIWREQRERETNPDAFPPPSPPEEDEAAGAGAGNGGFGFDDLFKDLLGSPEDTPQALDAKAVYRRLVQQLHPDRGGEWTAVRERLWHEVQAAWAARDGDWLARLEVDWEAANDVLSVKSSVGRLRQAVLELDAARRDTERKLRVYRKDPAWRFTKSPRKQAELSEAIEQDLSHDLARLQRELQELKQTIAPWEEDWTRPGRRNHRQRPSMSARERTT